MPRSDRQRDASRANGRRSKGPVTAEGKARSAQNAKGHGLTGKLEAGTSEAAYLESLLLRLRERYDPADAYQGQLMQIALNSELRMLRTYALIRDEISATLSEKAPGPSLEKEKLTEMAQKIWSGLFEMTGDKRLDTAMPEAFVGMVWSPEPISHLPEINFPKTNLSTLVGYAQRFRGQRDRALKKLEASKT